MDLPSPELNRIAPVESNSPGGDSVLLAEQVHWRAGAHQVVTDNDSGGDRGLMSRLWRAPRWSDGRLISHGEDNLAMATRAMGGLLLLVLSWACGSADIPDIYVDANLSILPGLLGGPIGLTVYWMTRRCIVIANKAATKAEVAN